MARGGFVRTVAREARERWRTPVRRHQPPPPPERVTTPPPQEAPAAAEAWTATIAPATTEAYTVHTYNYTTAATTAATWGDVTRATTSQWQAQPQKAKTYTDPWADLYLDEGEEELEYDADRVWVWGRPERERLFCAFGAEAIGEVYVPSQGFKGITFKGIPVRYATWATENRLYTYARGQQWGMLEGE